MRYRDVEANAQAQLAAIKEEKALRILTERIDEIDRVRSILAKLEKDYALLLDKEVDCD